MQDRRVLSFVLFVAVLIAGLPLSNPARATTITIENLDGPGEGFNDPSPRAPVGGNTGTTLGAQRLIAFQYAADMWAARLSSDVEIKVGAQFNPLSCDAGSAVLGQAGPETVHRDFSGVPVANTWYVQALANRLAGIDLAPSVDDIAAEFNSAIGTTCPLPRVWYYGLDGMPPGSAFDLVTIVLHELAHGFGFITLVDLSTGAKFASFDDTYMLYLENHNTLNLYPVMTNAERVVASKAGSALHWIGSAVVGASGSLTGGVGAGGHVQMYAPNPQEEGSSVSHFSTALTPDEIMEPTYTGPNHDVGLAAPLLEDIGWALSPAHDSIVLAPKPLNVTIQSGVASVSKTLKVKVRNADPKTETAGHTITLTPTSDCPAGVSIGTPDFGTTPLGSVNVAGGRSKTAKVMLTISRDAFTNVNRKAPSRCTLAFEASSTGSGDPTPKNNHATVELNVVDMNDTDQTTAHESLIQSVGPVVITIPKLTSTKQKSLTVKVGNADIVPVAENPGDEITVTASDGDCPSGTVGMIDFGTGTSNTVIVKGGQTKGGPLPLTISNAFTTASAKAPARCTAVLTATGPSNPDPDPTNNRTQVTIDVIDKNDF